jgi:hypothetical protein
MVVAVSILLFIHENGFDPGCHEYASFGQGSFECRECGHFLPRATIQNPKPKKQ